MQVNVEEMVTEMCGKVIWVNFGAGVANAVSLSVRYQDQALSRRISSIKQPIIPSRHNLITVNSSWIVVPFGGFEWHSRFCNLPKLPELTGSTREQHGIEKVRTTAGRKRQERQELVQTGL